MRMPRVAMCVAFVVTVVAARASAAPVSYNAVLDTAVYSYFSDTTLPFPFASSRVSMESSGALPTFSANFLNDKQLTVTYAAPAGERFAFSPPAGADSVELLMWFGDVSLLVYGAGMSEPGVSITFAGSEGPLPTQTTFSFAYGDSSHWPGDADHFVGSYRALFSGPFAFESVTAVFTVPAAFALTYSDLHPVVGLFGTAYWGSFGGSDPSTWTDPGAWASTEPITAPAAVPEPATLMLMLIGGGCAGLDRWRRARWHNA